MVQQHSDAGAGGANLSERSVVASIVANDAATAGNLTSQHSFYFFIAVAAVGARGNKDRHILHANTWHLGKQRLDHDLARLCPCDIANGNTNGLAGSYDFP